MATTAPSRSSISTAPSKNWILTSGARTKSSRLRRLKTGRARVDVEPEDTENEFDAAPGVNGSSPFEAIDRGEADGFSELEMPDEPQERP